MPDGALVRADIDPWTFQGFGNLGALVVADVRRTHRQGHQGDLLQVRDLGIRCIRAPCFSLGAAQLNRPLKLTVSSLDLTPADAAAEGVRRERRRS